MAETPCCTQTSQLCLLYVRSYCRLQFFIVWIRNFAYLLRKMVENIKFSFVPPNWLTWYRNTFSGLLSTVLACNVTGVTCSDAFKVLFHADRRRISGCGHFQSRDKDGGHTIRSATSENPKLGLYANFTTLSFIDPELLPIEVLYCGNREFRVIWRKIVEIIKIFCSHPKKYVAVTETHFLTHYRLFYLVCYRC